MVPSVRRTARTHKCPGCLASRCSVQGPAPLALLRGYPGALCVNVNENAHTVSSRTALSSGAQRRSQRADLKEFAISALNQACTYGIYIK